MKKIFMILLTGAVLSACTDKKAEEKTILDSIMATHDKVMGADEQLMKNKMQLDTLAKQNLPTKDSAEMLSKMSGAAENNMENWMHKFDPEHKGKSNDETIAYLNDQKKQITQIDSELTAMIEMSN